MTAQELINLALRDAGILAQGESPNADESNDGLTTINHILGMWSLEGLSVYAIKPETLALVAGTASYTIGPTGTLVTQRPVQIVAARASVGNYGRGLKILPVGEWADIVERGGAVNLPSKLYVDYAYPSVKLHLWPTPLVQSSLELHTVDQFGTADDAGQITPALMKQTQTYTLQANVSSYTLGPGATAGTHFSATRPARVIAATVYTAAYRRSVDIIPAAEWSTFMEPLNTGIVMPVSIYPQYGYPDATVYLWPVPGAGVTLEIHSLQQFASVATLATNITLPTGYETALRFALAAALAPSYGRAVTPELGALAQAAKQSIQTLNASILGLGQQAAAPPAQQ